MILCRRQVPAGHVSSFNAFHGGDVLSYIYSNYDVRIDRIVVNTHSAGYNMSCPDSISIVTRTQLIRDRKNNSHEYHLLFGYVE